VVAARERSPPPTSYKDGVSNTSSMKSKWEYTDSETLIPPTTKGDDSNSCTTERDAADHPIGGDIENRTFVPETLDIAAGSRPCDTH
jgi:hypothetical protein